MTNFYAWVGTLYNCHNNLNAGHNKPTDETKKKRDKMKKLITAAVCALGMTFGAFAAETQYKVYDFTITLKSTKAGGSLTTSCGDSYNWRTKGTRKLVGVLAGCGCVAMAGDETCENFSIYLWDSGTKTQLTNFVYETKILQRIGKKGEQAEQLVLLKVEDPDGEKFELTLAGIGTYKASKNDANYDYVMVNGNVTGIVDAPYLFTKGCSSCCGYGTPDSIDQTTAVKVCEDGLCTASDTSDTTVCFGTYTFKYNIKKSALCEKKGISKKSLGLPSYVDL